MKGFVVKAARRVAKRRKHLKGNLTHNTNPQSSMTFFGCQQQRMTISVVVASKEISKK
jgi:hypothetical protein